MIGRRKNRIVRFIAIVTVIAGVFSPHRDAFAEAPRASTGQVVRQSQQVPRKVETPPGTPGTVAARVAAHYSSDVAVWAEYRRAQEYVRTEVASGRAPITKGSSNGALFHVRMYRNAATGQYAPTDPDFIAIGATPQDAYRTYVAFDMGSPVIRQAPCEGCDAYDAAQSGYVWATWPSSGVKVTTIRDQAAAVLEASTGIAVFAPGTTSSIEKEKARPADEAAVRERTRKDNERRAGQAAQASDHAEREQSRNDRNDRADGPSSHGEGPRTPDRRGSSSSPSKERGKTTNDKPRGSDHLDLKGPRGPA